MYARVYTCTYCGRKEHLENICFNRIDHLNFTNKSIWVPYNTNPHGPKKKCEPIFPPLMFDVGVGSSKT